MAALSVYLDASVLVSLFARDAHSARADRTLRTLDQTLAVSDFAAAEFASGISQHVRARELTAAHARTIFAEFDEWCLASVERVDITPADIMTTTGFLRCLDTALRTPDAIHVAIARRIGAELLTFDKVMAAAARGLGVGVIA